MAGRELEPEAVSSLALLQRWLLGPERSVDAAVADGLLPAGVTVRTGRWIPALGGFFGRMGAPAAAVTLGRNVVVHPDVRLSRRLLAHELEHVRQWDADVWFPLRYTVESLRRGYFDNRYELQARAAEGRCEPSPSPGDQV